ncbi:ABC transporter ATP-binding protein [Butyricicoccus sp. AF10-3]|nr:ABC transporter ATP-binding protein [Butyricicoccus sp. AF10-3]RHS36382.1 ABC transporter ATP-binding protein [Butyricicoccus sp. AF10-3]
MIKRLLKSVREFKKDALLTPFFVVLEVVMEVIIPMVMALLIDKGIDGQDMAAIWKYGIILVLCAMLALVFGAAAGTFAARASTGFARNLRHDMYYNVQNFSFSNIDKFSTGSIVTRLTTDVTNVQNAFQMCTRIAVRCPVMLVFALFMAMKINSRMALVFLAVLPILAIGMGILMKVVGPVFERAFKIYDRMNTVVQENVRGIRVVKTYVREDHETEKFEGVSGMLYRTFSKAQKTMAGVMPLMQFCMYACMLLISWFGARLIVGASMTTGELTSMFSYAMQILMSLMMVAMVFVMITMAKASAERVAEILDEQPDLHNPANPIHEVKDGAIEFDDVSFSYKGDAHKLALKNVNLHIKAGQTVGILGGTGSAKSTLVQLIPRLYDTTHGTVKVGGVDVRDYDIEALRDQVAMVLQKNVLFSGTIKENLRWGDENASDEELERVCRLAQADEFIQQMPDKYDTHIEQGGSNVSGGQKQRLCIARALLKKPKILILDDSTSAVDTKTDALIRKAFAEEIPDTTKIIIAQRVSSVQDADQIVILDGGTVQAVGTHDELLAANTIYQEIYNQQNRKGGEE